MKKLRFAMILLLCLGVFLCLGAAASAEPAVIDSGTCGLEGGNGGNLTWTLYDTGELVIDGTGEIAPYSKGTAPWYKNRLIISSVTIHDGVTSIGDYAFYYNIKLEAVSIPDTVRTIRESAFDNCTKLVNVTIPEGVTAIREYAFYGCSSLTSVNIPEGVTSIGYSAFEGCSSLTSVSIPEGVTSIGVFAFSGCSSLTSVSIPEGVTSIGWAAFRGCSSLTSVNIPEGVTSIGSDAFRECSSLAIVSIPEGVTSIDRSAFNGCSSLTSVSIPEGVTSIGSYAFYNCTALADVYYGGSEAQWETISIGDYNNPLKNATIHYGWIPEIYTVSYDPNGGKDAPASQQKTQTVPLTLSDMCPTHENSSAGTYSVRLNPNDGGQSISVLRAARTTTYSFKGWNTAADGSGTDYAPGASYTADADVTLYAQWESTTKTAPVTLPELARDDGIFKGWAESRDAGSVIVGEYTPTGNVTLYALWHRADLVLPASLNTIESEAFTGGAFTYVFIPETVERIDGNAFASCPKLAYAQFACADTVIDGNDFNGVTGLTIIAPDGSTAETFAAAHGFDFVPAA